MGTTLSGKLKNCLSDSCGYAMRIGKRIAGTLDSSRIFVVAAGILLGILLVVGPAEVSTQETNADGDLRLVNTDDGTVVDLSTATAPSGRLEIFDDEDGDGSGEWKGICDDGLGTLGTEEENNVRIIGRQEAEVACRQLGFSGGTPMTRLAAPSGVETGDGKTSLSYYLLDDLVCSGSETAILGEGKCKHLPRGQNNCTANEAFGVTCAAPTSNNDAVGRVEISHTETKTGVTATADHSGITDADGKPTQESSFSYQWIRSDIVWNETEISGATSSTYTFQSDDEENWVKVRIRFTDDAGNQEEVESFEVGPVYPDLPDGHIRLVAVTTINPDTNEAELSDPSRAGLVRVFDNQAKRWKGVCDDLWDDTDASVVCGQLGLSGGTAWTNILWIGYSAPPFLLDDVECDGTEQTLLECPHAGRGVHNCAAWEYAGVVCEAAQ